MSSRTQSRLLSVVVPCLDEEAVIRETHRRLVAALEGAAELDFEIIYVDDGSGDATPDILRELQASSSRRVRGLAGVLRNHMLPPCAGT